jgi:aryl-alcohol dehydrogenase-like predicted oxidoreductase
VGPDQGGLREDEQSIELTSRQQEDGMDHCMLGSTGVEIARIILGCGTFGGIGGSQALIGRGLDREAAFATLDESLGLGVDVLDTAESYAGGASELTIGTWLSEQPAEVRATLHIATKVAPPNHDDHHAQRFDRAYIERKLALSLERLKTPSVSFYLSHAPDPTTPIEETIEGFAAVLESGRVRHIGCCNVGPRELLMALEASDRSGLPAFELVQNGFSLLAPEDYREVRAICADRRLGFTPFSPLAGGVLTGKYKRGEPFPPDTRMALRPDGVDKLLSPKAYDALDHLAAMAADYKVSSAELALAWILAHPDCTAPVVGPSRGRPHLGHLKEAMGVELQPDDVTKLAGWFSNDR